MYELGVVLKGREVACIIPVFKGKVIEENVQIIGKSLY